jgi:DNA polymerase-3 subunit gamma/tau
MAYTALYRKFRPKTFEEVKGQQHIIGTLKNQIKADRIGHAYLFCGTRGTGKTSVAKIFAKAVNCEHPIDGSPCNECETCKSIAEGSSMNVIEIDAASNNGVDSIRQIRDEVTYSPTQGKYKVYIIDEVHMLSIGAFNALLKTLEEPPSYVIFILATTEVHKIPVTILSRCQRYDFKRITVDTIVERLTELVQAEKVEAEPKALRYIARQADGAMRDAQSLLDQCLAFYMNEPLTYEHALEVLGAVDTSVFSKLLQAVITSDISQAMEIVEQVVMLGKELGQFVVDFTWYLRNLMLIQTGADGESFLDVARERLEQMQAEAAQIDENRIMRYIRILSELSNQIKFATNKRVFVEVALIKMMRPQMEQDTSALLLRIEELEKKLESGAFVTAQAMPQMELKTAQPAVQKPKKLAVPIPADVQEVVDQWGQIAAQITPPMSIYLKDVRFSVEGEDTLLIVFTDATCYEAVRSKDGEKLLTELVENTTGKAIGVRIKLLEADTEFQDVYTEIQKHIHFEIEEEDF